MLSFYSPAWLPLCVQPGSSTQTQVLHCSMDTPSPDPLPSPLPGEEEKPLALLSSITRDRLSECPREACSSNQTLKACPPHKRVRPPKSGQEPPLAKVVTASVGGGRDLSDLLLILIRV
uniref:Uncharacterized protein n=1 Tax=Myotis myotis TaxID=51298 RepID=A0A7J7R0C8_MYOMY|nr:hypothetical protein mMyoMyo1_011241 [Myotis myotis]